MKNLTKKRGFFAVAAALLVVTTMLVTTWCSNDIGGKPDEFTPPAGKGAVKLIFNKEIARTILPDDIDIDYFDLFDFVFDAVPSGTGISWSKTGIDPNDLTDNLTTPIVLDPGDYTLTVIAYKNSIAMAKNDPAVPVTITPATTTSATIVLKPYDQVTGNGNGTFKYKITSSILAANITTADLNLVPILAGNSQAGVNVKTYWNNGAFQNLTVKAGDYYLDFVINVKSGETVTFRHIVHIYQNMTSTYTFTINPDYFNAYFTLVSGDMTYDHSEDKLPALTADGVSKTEGAIIEVDEGDSVTIAVTNGTEKGFTSYEWYTQNTSSYSSAATYTFDTTLPAFSARKTYLLTVVGVVSATEKYYTYINIRVVAAP